MCGFFALLRAQDANESPVAANRRHQIKQANVTASLVGRYDPLGVEDGGLVPLRNPSNVGGPELRSHDIGNLSTEVCIKDKDDEERCTPAPRKPSMQLSTLQRQNVVWDSGLASSLTQDDTLTSH